MAFVGLACTIPILLVHRGVCLVPKHIDRAFARPTTLVKLCLCLALHVSALGIRIACRRGCPNQCTWPRISTYPLSARPPRWVARSQFPHVYHNHSKQAHAVQGQHSKADVSRPHEPDTSHVARTHWVTRITVRACMRDDDANILACCFMFLPHVSITRWSYHIPRHVPMPCDLPIHAGAWMGAPRSPIR